MTAEAATITEAFEPAPQDVRACTRTERDELAERLFRSVGPKVMALGRRFFAGDNDKAEELVAETFARVITALPRFKGDAAYSTWIYRIAMNVIADGLRKNMRAKRGTGTEADAASPFSADETPSNEPTPSFRARKLERERLLNAALESLGPEHRMVLSLVGLQGLSHAEAATLLGVPEGTVWSRYARARIALAKRFEEMGLLAEDVLEE